MKLLALSILFSKWIFHFFDIGVFPFALYHFRDILLAPIWYGVDELSLWGCHTQAFLLRGKSGMSWVENNPFIQWRALVSIYEINDKGKMSRLRIIKFNIVAFYTGDEWSCARWNTVASYSSYNVCTGIVFQSTIVPFETYKFQSP